MATPSPFPPRSSAAPDPRSRRIADGTTSALLSELKTRARLQRNAHRGEPAGPSLRHCLDQAARNVGFTHWEQTRCVLGGLAEPGDDMGTFWHAPRCDSLLNEWYADAAQARAALAARAGAVLLPYRRQYIVVGEPFLRELGLDPDHAAWTAARRDLVQAYGSAPWRELAALRLKAPRSSFAA